MNDLEFRGFSQLVLEFFLSSGDGKHLLIKELFDAQGDLNVPPAIASLAGTILLRGEHWKLCLPISKHVRLYANEIANFADLKINFLRYHYSCVAHFG